MPTLIQTYQGRVTGLWGTARMRGADGKMRRLKIGDLVNKGDVILTSQDGIVQLTAYEAPVAKVADATAAATPPAPATQTDIDRVIADLNAPIPTDPTAAGVAGGDGAGDLAPGLRVDRIAEAVTPATLERPDLGLRSTPELAAASQEQAPEPVLAAESTAISAVEEGPSVSLGLRAPTGASDAAVITVTQLPAVGLLLKADGTPVVAGSTLTPAELSGLRYEPPADYNGNAAVGSFGYTVLDQGRSVEASVQISVQALNDGPVARADSASTAEDTPTSGNLLANDSDAEGNPLSVTGFNVGGVAYSAGSSASIPGIGTLLIGADGAYVFTPSADYAGAVPLVAYTVSDGNTTATSTIAFNLTPVADAPVAGADSAPTAINQPVNIAVLTNDRDGDGDALSVTAAALSNPAQGSVTINPDGTLTFTPASNVAGPVTITYSISDGQGGSSSASVTVNVGANTPPTGTDATRTLAEDGRYTVQGADFGFADADAGQSLALVRIESLPAAGALLLDGVPIAAGAVVSVADVGAGRLVFVPAPDASGAAYANFVFSVQDSAGAFDTAPNTLTFNVTAANDAPVAQADTASGAEDAPINGNVLANDRDTEADPLVVTQFTIGGATYAAGSAASVPGVGTLLLRGDGSYTFTPAPDYAGPVPAATYSATDGAALTTGTLSLTVTSVNDAPVATGDAASTPINVPVVVDVLGSDRDVDGDPLTVTSALLADPSKGSVAINPDGTLRFTPAADVTGAVAITYTVSDGQGGTSSATLTVNVGSNAPPTGVDSTQTLAEDGSYGVRAADFGFTDADAGQALAAVRIDALPGAGSLLLAGTPVLAGQLIAIADVNAGRLVFTPAANANAAPYASFSFSVQDSAGAFDTVANVLTLNVTPVNDGPVASADGATTAEDTPRSGNVLSNDSDVDADTLSVTQFVVGGTTYTAGSTATLAGVGTLVIAANGTYAFSPESNYNGAVPVATYTVSDGTTTSSSTLTLSVTPVNDGPVAMADSATTAEDTSATGNVLTNDSDVDGNLLSVTQFVVGGSTYTAGSTASLAGVGTLVIATNGAYTFTPAANYNGAVPVATYTVSDGTTGTTSTLTLNVTPVNDGPIGNADSATTAEDTPTSGNVLTNDTDVDGNTLSVTQFVVGGTTYIAGTTATLAGVGTLVIATNGAYTFTPASNYNGAVPVATYTVSDGTTGATSTLTLNVTPVNDGPVAVADTASTPINTALASIAVLANDSDVDGNTLSVTSAALVNPALGSVSINPDGSLRFTPAFNVTGPVTINYAISDGNGGTATAAVTVNIGANTPPTGTDSVRVLAEDGWYTISGTDFGFSDGDVGQTLANVRIDALPAAGSLQLNGVAVAAGQLVSIADIDAGRLVFVPAANGNGAPYASFSFSVQDSAGAFDTVVNVLTLNVTPVNDGPVGNADTAATTEDTPATGNVLTNDSDVDGNTLSVTQFVVGGTTYTAGTTATLAGLGTLVIATNGAYTFTPAADYNGAVPVATYTVSDGTTSSSSTLALNVTPVNDGPVGNLDTGTTAEDTPASGNVLTNDSDVEGNTLSVTQFVVGGTTYTAGSEATLAGVGTLVIAANGAYTFTPAANYNGAVPVATYSVSDGAATSSSTLTLNVTPVNDGPVGNADTAVTAEDTPRSGNVLTNDTDVDGNTLSITQFVVGGTTYTAGSTATLAGLGTLVIATNGSYTFTPGANYNGAVPVATYTVSDGTTGTTSTLTLDVTPVNDAPVGTVDSATTAEDTPATGNVLTNDTDVDGNTLSVTQFVVGGGTYTAGSTAALAGVGTLVIATDGAYTFTPAANYNGSVPVATYTVSDSTTTATSTLTLNVTPVNDGPIGNVDTGTTAEDTPASGNVLTNDSDVDGNTLSVTQFVVGGTTYIAGSTATLDGVGTLVIAANGAYTFTPAANYNGAVPVATYTVSDSTTTSTSTLTLNVTPVNDGPVGNADTAATTEDTPATGNVLTNDRDVDGNTLSVTQFVVSGTTYTAGSTATLAGVGTLVIATNGSYTFTPAVDYNGAVPVATYTVSDGTTTSSSTLTLNVTPVNDAPVGNADTAATVEDTPTSGNVLTNDSDVDGNPLSVTQFVVGGTTYTAGTTATLAGLGTLVIATNGAYTFTPAADYNGAVPVATYTFSDGTTSSSSTLTLNVTPVNDGPVGNADTAATTEDTPATGNVLTNDSDVDGNTLSVTQFVVSGTTYTAGSTATLAGVGTLVIATNGAYTFTPVANYNGAVPVATYTVSDSTTTSTSTLTLNVTPVNDGPVAVADTASTPINTALASIAVLANDSDVDGNTLSVTSAALVNPALGSVSINPDGSLRFTPAFNVTGPVTVNYAISDGNGGTASAAVTVNVGTNTPPTGTDQTVSLAEDSSKTFASADFGFADTDAGQTLAAVRVDTLPAAGSLTLGGVAVAAGQVIAVADLGQLLFMPPANANGTGYASFTFSVQDNGGAFDSAPNTITFNVTPVNDGPVATSDSATTAEDTSTSGNVLTNDTDVDGNTLSVTQFVVGGTTYTAGSTAAVSGVGTLAINAEGSYTFSPATNYNGAVPVATYTVSDGSTSSTSTLTLNVTPVNDGPVGNADTAATAEDTPATGNVLTNDTDVDGNPLSVTQFVVGGTTYTAGSTATLAGVGTLVIAANGAYTFTPAADYNGAVPVATYTVSDGSTSSTSTLTLNVTPVNDGPVGNADTAAAAEDTPAIGNVLANDTDVDGNPLSVTQFVVGGTTYTAGSTATIAGVGTLVIAANGAYTFTPASNFNGAVPVATYTVSDGTTTATSTSTSTLTLNVSAVNDGPVGNADTAAAAEDTPAIGNVLTNDTDVDGNPLSVTQFVVGGTTYTAGSTATLAGVGTLLIAANGAYTFTPAANYNGAVPVATYTVSDGSTSSTSTLTLNVTPVNDGPVGNADSAAAAEDTPATGNVLTNDTDVDGNPLSVTQFVVGGTTYTAGSTATVAGVGTLVIAADGGYTFTPAANYNGAVPVATYTVSDGSTSSTSTLTLDVTPVNDGPVGNADTAAAAEDTPATGNVLTNDTDVDGNPLSVTQFVVGGTTYTAGSAATIAGVGTLVIAADGGYTFTPAANYNGAVPVATYTVSDGTATANSTLTLSVTAANDAPVANADTASATEAGGVANNTAGSNPSGNVLTNDTDADAGDTRTVSAVSGAAAGTVGASTSGSYGALVLNADGSYTYALDNSLAAVQALRAPTDRLTDTFSYTVRDAAGATSTATLTVTVSGSNDAPVAVADSRSATEDVTLTASAAAGVLTNDTDVDSGDAKAVSAVSFGATTGTVGSALGGTYGTLTLNADGSYSYLANRAPAAALAAGQTATEQFTYTTRDSAGATASSTLTFTVTGTNDAPTVTADTGTTREDTPLATTAATGLLANDTDVDSGSALSVTQFSVAGVSGTFTAGSTATIVGVGTLVINANGSYAFTPTANYNGAVPVATYTVSDGAATTSSTLTLTVSAVNDAPAGTDRTVTTAEDTAYTLARADFGFTDPLDATPSNFAAVSVGPTTAGTLTLNGVAVTAATVVTVAQLDAGQLRFTPASNVSGSGYASLQFQVRDDGGTAAGGADTDASSNTLTFNVTAVNDAPVAVADAATAVEAGGVSNAGAGSNPTGNVLTNDTDPDAGDSKTVTAVAGSASGTVGSATAGTYGALTLNADGSYSYAVNNASAAVQGLRSAANTLTDSFTYTVRDAAGATSATTLTVTIQGANDTPVATVDTAAATENVTLSTTAATGVLANDTDVDAGDTKTVSSVSFGATAGTVGTALGGTYGSLTLNADGSYSYLANRPAAESLAAGQAVTEQFSYTVRDAAGTTSSTTLTFTVTGTNDAPVAIADTAAVTENMVFSATAATGVLANDTDVDTGATRTVSGVSFGATAGTVGSGLSGTYGTLTLNADGSYAYLANRPAAEALGQGQTATEQFTYTVRDNAGATATTTLTFTVTGTNDALVAGDDTSTVTEDAASTTLTVSAANGVIQSAGAPGGRDIDVDTGDVLSVTNVRTGTEAGTGTAGTVGSALVGTYGSLTLNANGSYTYVLNNSSPTVQNLVAGQTVNDVFTYTVNDGRGATDRATLTIAVNGAQDLTAGAPTVTPVAASGLSGAYYGYNENATTAAGIRTHSDDGTATFGNHNGAGNLNSVEDLYTIINGRNALAGGTSDLVGTAASGVTSAADVAFSARNLDYGNNPLVNSSLGSNSNVAAGSALPAGDNAANSTTRALENFLDQDNPTAVAQTGAGNTNGTSGLGMTTDAAVRLAGQIYVPTGSYDFRVSADDGFRLRVAGQTLFEFDGNQPPSTRIFTGVPLGASAGGLQAFELLYWEQGGNANLKIEYKLSSDPASSYQTMTTTNTALFSNENAPTLADPRIQDLVYDSATASWQLRTGSILDGGAGNETLTGGAGRDYITGGVGNDTLVGGAGDDTLDGGTGNNSLNGGAGNDTLYGGTGANTLTGGAGDDKYIIAGTGNTMVEAAGSGTDTVVLDATYVAANPGTTYTLAANFENLTALGNAAINLTGNGANNDLEGNSAANVLNGGAGNDYIAGGGGNDTLVGGAGSDTFAWRLADAGTPGAPTIDTITDFNYGGGYSNIQSGTAGVATGGGDVLDLRDLLQGERTSVGSTGGAAANVEISNLLNYLDVQIVGADTVLRVSKTGGFAGGTYAAANEDERIVLSNVNLYSQTGVTAGDEANLLRTLIKNGTMVVD